MGIKWENIHVGVTGITNEIVLMEGEKRIYNNEVHLFAIDGSDDRTQEVLDAAIQYFLTLIERSGGPERKVIMEREGLYRLTFEDLREASTNGH